ncbi:hypothetical protein PYW07_017073 [Mythimna separata]|uniref:Cathepsin propeptide inhibitor domain-containing protein n=1 Tax=Mythimna separata TaxID=271217 RepID=A0AAD7YXW5_MYTSE|nr:hypothetical protein PYW07_017073 [Mythimna separata]
MRSVSLVLLLAVAAMTSAAPNTTKPHYDLSKAKDLFEDYIKEYNKIYKDEADKEVHFQAFVKTLKIVNESNELSTSATFDINLYSDWTIEEIKVLLGVREEKKKPQN